MDIREEHAEFYHEIEKLENKGVRIIVETLSVDAQQLIKEMEVREEGAYMLDYVLDARGNVREIIFNNISES